MVGGQVEAVGSPVRRRERRLRRTWVRTRWGVWEGMGTSGVLDIGSGTAVPADEVGQGYVGRVYGIAARSGRCEHCWFISVVETVHGAHGHGSVATEVNDHGVRRVE